MNVSLLPAQNCRYIRWVFSETVEVNQQMDPLDRDSRLDPAVFALHAKKCKRDLTAEYY
jgi:hypothetical protein